jgi:two-component system sensor histidine kinase UhpB
VSGKRARSNDAVARVRDLSLMRRIFLTNAFVVVAAAAILILSPATLSPDARLQEVAVIVAGLGAMLLIDLVLLRRAFAPLTRLTAEMHRVELLEPGRRVPVYGGDSEIVELTRAFNEMLDRLEQERRNSVRRSLAAQEGERQRVAQELHDEVGQTLTAITLQLGRLARIAPEEVRPDIEEARETARGSLEEVRAISKRLRPEALDDLGLTSALGVLTDRLSDQTGKTIERRIARGLPALQPEVELVLYRVAQEALTNAVRHAGASRMTVALIERGDEVLLTVVDDGQGLDGADPGAGIQGMRERALMIGAELELTSPAGGGTEVSLLAPARRLSP